VEMSKVPWCYRSSQWDMFGGAACGRALNARLRAAELSRR
jgi:hypothetical protein